MKLLLSKLSYANLIGTLALFLAVGGGGAIALASHGTKPRTAAKASHQPKSRAQRTPRLYGTQRPPRF